jgi:hypothetical protein
MPHLRSIVKTVHNMFEEMPKTRGVADCGSVNSDGQPLNMDVLKSVKSNGEHMSVAAAKLGEGDLNGQLLNMNISNSANSNGEHISVVAAQVSSRNKLQGMHAGDSNEHVADEGIVLGEGTASSRTPNNHGIDVELNQIATPGPSSYAKAIQPSSPIVNEVRSPSLNPLQYMTPSIENGRVKVRPPVEVAIEGSEEWEASLVGYFVEKRLPFPVVNSVVQKIWSWFGLREVLSSEKGFFIFKFDSVEHACEVLERGPWHIVNKLLVLKRWQPSLSLSQEELRNIPLWAKIHNLPFELWTSKGLSFVASALGIPLHADHVTLTRKRLSYARVCVEVDATKDVVRDFDVKCSNGEWKTIHVNYEWLPSRCNVCKVFGHDSSKCRSNVQVSGDETMIGIGGAVEPNEHVVKERQEPSH